MQYLPHIAKSAGFGVFAVAVFWIVYFIWALFVPDVREDQLSVAEASRITIYLLMQLFSIQVWVFSSLFYYLWKKK